MKLTKLAQSIIQHVLIYGPPKTGKNTLLNELLKEFNLLVFSLENGHGPLYKLPLELQGKVEIVNIPDTRSYPIAIQTMLKVIKGEKQIICDEHGAIGCTICKAKALNDPEVIFTEVELKSVGPDTIVVVDSLTQLTSSAIAHITKNQPDDYKLDYDDWGNLGKLMEIFLSHVQQLGCHVICISHETETEMEDGKIKIVPTAGTRNFSRNSAKYFDHVLYTQVANMKHTVKSVTTSTVNIVVGSRTDFDFEKAGSLLPLFNGKMPVAPAPQTNGQKAAAGLAGLLKKG